MPSCGVLLEFLLTLKLKTIIFLKINILKPFVLPKLVTHAVYLMLILPHLGRNFCDSLNSSILCDSRGVPGKASRCSFWLPRKHCKGGEFLEHYMIAFDQIVERV